MLIADLNYSRINESPTLMCICTYSGEPILKSTSLVCKQSNLLRCTKEINRTTGAISGGREGGRAGSVSVLISGKEIK